VTFQESIRVELVGKPWLLGWHVTGVQHGMTNGSDVVTRLDLQGEWTLDGVNRAALEVRHDPRNVLVGRCMCLGRLRREFVGCNQDAAREVDVGA